MIREWCVPLGLNHWWLRYNFKEEKHLATCSAEPRYKRALLQFNLKRIREECDAEDLEETVIHELMHCHTWRIWDFAGRLVERYVPKVSQVDMDGWLEEIHEECVTELGYTVMRVKKKYGG